MRIAPPLTITDNEIRLACQVILNSINSLETHFQPSLAASVVL